MSAAAINTSEANLKLYVGEHRIENVTYEYPYDKNDEAMKLLIKSAELYTNCLDFLFHNKEIKVEWIKKDSPYTNQLWAEKEAIIRCVATSILRHLKAAGCLVKDTIFLQLKGAQVVDPICLKAPIQLSYEINFRGPGVVTHIRCFEDRMRIFLNETDDGLNGLVRALNSFPLQNFSFSCDTGLGANYLDRPSSIRNESAAAAAAAAPTPIASASGGASAAASAAAPAASSPDKKAKN